MATRSLKLAAAQDHLLGLVLGMDLLVQTLVSIIFKQVEIKTDQQDGTRCLRTVHASVLVSTEDRSSPAAA